MDARSAFDQGTGGGLRFLALLVTRAVPRFAPVELVAAVNRLLRDTGIEAGIVHELTEFPPEAGSNRIWHRGHNPPRVGLMIGDFILTIEGHDVPALPRSKAPALDLAKWPTGAEQLARTRAHLRVTEAGETPGGDIELAHDRAAAITLVSTAAAGLVGAAGVIWATSLRALPGVGLDGALTLLKAGRSPLDLWLATIRTTAGATLTRGLLPFAGIEIGVGDTELEPEAATALARELAGEILATGQLPAADMVLGHESGRRYRVGYQPAGTGGAAVPLLILARIRDESDEPRFAAGA